MRLFIKSSKVILLLTSILPTLILVPSGKVFKNLCKARAQSPQSKFRPLARQAYPAVGVEEKAVNFNIAIVAENNIPADFAPSCEPNYNSSLLVDWCNRFVGLRFD